MIAEFAKRYGAKAVDRRGRSPRKLAEDALLVACEEVVPKSLTDLMMSKHKLKPSEMRSLVVRSEPIQYWSG